MTAFPTGLFVNAGLTADEAAICEQAWSSYRNEVHDLVNDAADATDDIRARHVVIWRGDDPDFPTATPRGGLPGAPEVVPTPETIPEPVAAGTLFPTDAFLDAGMTDAETTTCALRWSGYLDEDRAACLDTAARSKSARREAIARWRGRKGGLPI